MRYIFETAYNRQALTCMAKCIRKTARKSHSKRSHILGWIVTALAILLPFASSEDGSLLTFRSILTWGMALILLFVLLFEDRINGYFAGKRMLKGTEKALSVFDTENTEMFTSETAVGKSEFSYDRIMTVAETDRYFVFIFSANHAQIYDKTALEGGSPADFAVFLTERTGKSIVTVGK